MVSKSSYSKENGVALIVSLLILLLISIISVTSMKNAAMQQKMSHNFELKGRTFQIAEGTAQQSMPDLAILQRAKINRGTVITETADYPTQMAEAQISYSFVGSTPVIGWSLNSSGTGSSLFLVTSTVEMESVGARSSVQQGYQQVNPQNGG